MPNPSRYRTLDYIAERILEAREVNLAQSISQNVDSGGNITSYGLSALYRQGALLNTTISVSGSTATLAPTNNTLPMQIFVRDRWETILSGEIPSVTVSTGNTTLYLNWQLALVTSVQDPTLVDSTTGEPTANAGELQLSFSLTDTSALSLSGSQLAKNTSPIIVCTFTQNGATWTPSVADNVQSPARANQTTGGLVKLTTGTASGVAVSTDDPRMSDARNVLPNAVTDASVRTPVGTGSTNADGSAQYTLGPDPGGISAAKIILTATTQLLSDAWTLLKSQVSSLLASFNAHATATLGLSNTHPFPTPSQVGAAPASHVGQALGLSTSHPPEVTANSGGFSVTRDPAVTPSANDPAFGLISGTTLETGLLHNGDVTSSAAGAYTASPGGTGITVTGSLKLLSTIAGVLAQHVNQTSHGNPHGLTLGDLGAVSLTQEQNDIANTLASAKTYTNTQVASATTTIENWVTAQFPALIASNGGIWLPGNLIIQWGTTGRTTSSGQSLTQAFNRVNGVNGFPTKCFGVLLTPTYTSGQHSSTVQVINGSVTTTEFVWGVGSGGETDGNTSCFWVAIGY